MPEIDVEDEAEEHADHGSAFGGTLGQHSEEEHAKQGTVCDGCDGESDLDNLAAVAREDGENEEDASPDDGRDPREEEAIFVLEGTAHMSIDGQEVVVPAGSIVQFPRSVLHDVRNPGPERCVIMFLKVNPKVLRDG